jgi:hypothetical protein
MDLSPAYLLIAASFLFLLFGMIAPTESVRTALFFLWMALMSTAAVIAHFVTRHRLRHIPCIRVNDPYRGYRLTYILIFTFSGYVLLLNPLGDSRPDDLTIPFLIFVFVLIRASFPWYKICGNGIWSWGELHTWDEYESYSWTTSDDGALVELKQRKKFREPFGSRLVRLTVPQENSDAAKQLLEANLVDSAPEEAKA